MLHNMNVFNVTWLLGLSDIKGQKEFLKKNCKINSALLTVILILFL